MLIYAILIVGAIFALLFVARIGGATRRRWLSRWPAIAFAVAAIVEGARGGFSMAATFAVLAAASWFLMPALNASRRASNVAIDPADADARAVLGLSANASEAEIRRAYRAKIAKAHPDQGGSTADAARITAARDRLLKRRR